MTKQAEYEAFIAKIDNAQAGSDQYGNLSYHVDCSAMANAEGDGEAMYASALQSAEMILDCWQDYYPALILDVPEAETQEVASGRLPGYKQFVAQYWTEDDGWQDSELDFDTEEEAHDWCRDRPHWRFYDADAKNEAEQMEYMAAEAERQSGASPECGCEWGCWRCQEDDGR